MFAPAPPLNVLRKMDYISDQKGIIRRFIRENKNWRFHLDHTAEFIREIAGSREIRHLIVLGSGWLLDFPLESIRNLVHKISLVDIYFPKPVIRKVKEYKNVELIQSDITGGIVNEVYNGLRTRGRFRFPERIDPPSIDPGEKQCILSLNILNQLDILLVDYILKKTRPEPELIELFRKRIQEAHLNMLRKHPFILITDTTEILINREGRKLEEKNLIFTVLPEGDVSREWEWQFDTHRLYHEHADTILKVKAIFSESPENL